MRWLRQKAMTAGCQFFRLDSGTSRAQAHKFYHDVLTMESFLEPVLIDGRPAPSTADAASAACRVAAFATKLAEDLGEAHRQPGRPGHDGQAKERHEAALLDG